MRALLLFSLVFWLISCGPSVPDPEPIPHPDAVASRLPTDEALARRLGLGARDAQPTSARLVHLTETLAVLEARTASAGAYLVVFDRNDAGWDVAGSVLAAPSGVTRIRILHAWTADSVDVAVEGESVGLWHVSTDPPRPGLRQVLTARGPGDILLDESGPFPRALKVGETRFVAGPDGYAAAH